MPAPQGPAHSLRDGRPDAPGGSWLSWRPHAFLEGRQAGKPTADHGPLELLTFYETVYRREVDSELSADADGNHRNALGHLRRYLGRVPVTLDLADRVLGGLLAEEDRSGHTLQTIRDKLVAPALAADDRWLLPAARKR